MELLKPRAILFDWDNTLADTWPTIHASMAETFKRFDREPWSLEETKLRVHRSLRDFFPEIFPDNWQEVGDVYLEVFRSIHLDNLVPIDGAEDVLKVLQEADVFVGVVSNKTGSSLRLEVEYLGWQDYFDKVVGAKDAEEDKPSAKPVQLVLEESGVAVGPEVWLIGDSVTDMECAYNAGCVPIFYGDQNLADERFVQCQPVKHCRDHNELLRFVVSVV